MWIPRLARALVDARFFSFFFELQFVLGVNNFCYFSSLITFYQMHWWYSNFDRIKQRCVQFLDIIWWHNSLSFFCYYPFFRKGFRFWPKILPGFSWDNRSAFQPWDLFMSLAVKGMIRIANEESNCLSSFVILTMPLIIMLARLSSLFIEQITMSFTV